MQKSLKIVSIVFCSLIFCLALFFAFNSKSEIKVLAESEIQVVTNETKLRTAVENAVPNVLTEIQLSGTIELTDKVLIQGTSGAEKIIKFVATEDTTIIRNSAKTEFIMFNIGEYSEVYFETADGVELIIDGNRTSSNIGDCTIFKNAGYLNIKGKVKIQNNYVSNNGAGILSEAGSTTELYNVVMTKLQARDKGGAICNSGTLELYNNCTLKDNIAGSFGGAICLISGSAKLESSNFDNNVLTNLAFTAKEYEAFGGAIGLLAGKVVASNCNFIKNNSHQGVARPDGEGVVKGYGGAIGVYNGTLEINESNFEKNNAGYGGAIALRAGNLTVNNFTVSGNTAKELGGGLYLKAGAVKILNGTIGNNETTQSGKAEDVEWLISDGGSTYLENNIFSANVTSENVYAIYSASNFPVGANFALGKGSHLQLLVDKTVRVIEKLKTKNEIVLIASHSSGSIVGKPVVYFVNDGAITEGVFAMITPEHNLLLNETGDANGKFLFVSVEYLVQFYQYYDEVKGNQNPLTAKDKPFEQRIRYGESATPPEDPGEREEMIFVGWEARLMTNPSKVESTISYDNITDNVYFCGVWGKKIVVNFVADDTPIGNPLEMVSNTAITQAQLNSYKIPAKTGYTETEPYWAILVDDELMKYENQKITESTTLFAVYIPNEMTVTLKNEKGIELKTFKVNYNDKLTADDINAFPTLETNRTGYDQVAPYWAFEDTTTQFDTEAVITENLTLVATYVKNKYTITFQVDYYKSGSVYESDTNFTPLTVEYSDVIPTLPTPAEKEGFNVENVVWDYNNNAIVEDLLVTGKIDINKYIVSFIIGEEVVKRIELEHFDNIPTNAIPTIPTKPGFDQKPAIWKGDLNQVVKSNLNFVAEYFLNVYKITFVLPDGTKIEPREVMHGHTVDASNVIDVGFGEIIQYDKPLENITANGEIKVSKINVFMWIMIGVGVIVLIVSAIMTYKLVKRRQVIAAARKRHRHIGPYVTGDDEFN